jgi:hypothetical protein
VPRGAAPPPDLDLAAPRALLPGREMRRSWEQRRREGLGGVGRAVGGGGVYIGGGAGRKRTFNFLPSLSLFSIPFLVFILFLFVSFPSNFFSRVICLLSFVMGPQEVWIWGQACRCVGSCMWKHFDVNSYYEISHDTI